MRVDAIVMLQIWVVRIDVHPPRRKAVCPACPRRGDLPVLESHPDLAAITGISRQFTNTTLQDLRARGLIATRNRNLIIVRPKEIATLAQVT